MPISVLVVDDSALIRSLLKEIIQADPELRLVGCAPDAFVARDLIKQHAPDVISLDVEMPRMDGLTFLDKLMKARPTPVLMISSLTERGSEATLRALELGAVDFIAKPRLGIAEGMQAYAEEIRAKLKTVARARLRRRAADAPAPPESAAPLLSTEKIIALGASTGGTEALKEVLLGLLIGFVATIPFWAMEATGFIIDNQRGAALASTLNPSLGSQTSPTGLLLTQTLITLFFSGGAFLALVGSLFRSYASWPVSSFFPQFGSQWVAFFYAQFSQMLMLCALFAAPLLIAMFLAEFGLALVSRFAPSLNVFILAMPIKSLVVSLLLVLYLGILMEHAYDALLLAVDPLRLLRPVLETP